MQSGLKTDFEVERFLNKTAAYADLAREAGEHWRQAFVLLAEARLSGLALTLPEESTAGTTYLNGLQVDNKVLRSELAAAAGGWPPSSAVRAQQEFVSALRASLRAFDARQTTEQ